MAKEIIELFGFSIRENSLYEIKEKLDPDAPDGFREFETSKLLINDINEEEPGAVWNTSLGVWDNGLFLDSPFLRSAIPNLEARQNALEKLQEYILEPIESLKGKGAFDISSSNDKFWNNYSITVNRGKGFNTAVPEELFQLYILLVSKRLTPKEMVSHPEFKTSRYCILDKEEANRKDSDKALRTIRAYELFGAFKNSDRKLLMNMLDFAGLRGVNEKTEDSTLSIAFKNWIEDSNKGVQNAINFAELAESKDKNTKNKLHVYGKLKEYLLNDLIVKNSSGIYIQDTYVGASIKGAAEAIVSDKALTKLFASIDAE